MKNTHPASATPGRLRRQITSVVAALSLSLGMIVTTATPAHAATSVAGCFSYNGRGFAAAGMPVTLWGFDGYSWSILAFDQLGNNGCMSWSNVPANSIVAMVVYTRQGGGLCQGVTNVAWPGYGFADLGTGGLSCSGYCR